MRAYELMRAYEVCPSCHGECGFVLVPRRAVEAADIALAGFRNAGLSGAPYLRRGFVLVGTGDSSHAPLCGEGLAKPFGVVTEQQ